MVNREDEGRIVYCCDYSMGESDAWDNASSWPVILLIYGETHCVIEESAGRDRLLRKFKNTEEIYPTEKEAYGIAINKMKGNRDKRDEGKKRARK